MIREPVENRAAHNAIPAECSTLGKWLIKEVAKVGKKILISATRGFVKADFMAPQSNLTAASLTD